MIIYPPVIDESLKILSLDDERQLVVVEARAKEIPLTLEGETDTITISFGGAHRQIFRISQNKLLTRAQKQQLRWIRKNWGEAAWDRQDKLIRNREISRYTNFNKR
jgi:hypothetical protein